MSDQSIDGADERGAAHRRAVHAIAPIRILPVPMRLDLTAEKERLDVGRATAKAKFDRYLAT